MVHVQEPRRICASNYGFASGLATSLACLVIIPSRNSQDDRNGRSGRQHGGDIKEVVQFGIAVSRSSGRREKRRGGLIGEAKSKTTNCSGWH